MESKKKTKFYHITDFKDHHKVIVEGLRSNEYGEIYVFNTNDKLIIQYASVFQLSLTNCALIEIDGEGITGSIEDDKVGEITSGFQKVIHQEIIKPEFLRLFITYKVKDPEKIRNEILMHLNSSRKIK